MISSAVKTPKILVRQPAVPAVALGLPGDPRHRRVKCGQAPLGLATVAGLTPREFPVELQDENVEPINFDTDADIVAIGCWSPQYLRSKELAQEFRRRGKTGRRGRPVPDALPGAVRRRHLRRRVRRRDREHLARVLPGPPRGHAAQAGVQAGRQHRHAEVPDAPLRPHPEGRLPLLLHPDDAGCPFACEFCDIIVTDGRIPRLKSIPQVLKEIETIAALGGKYISFSDANLIGNQKFAEQLLEALADVQPEERLSDPVLRRDDHHGRREAAPARAPAGGQLHQHLRRGSSRRASTASMESKKRQNAHRPLLDSVRLIQSHNLMIVAGMIVGFDHDDHRIFEEQFDFLMRSRDPLHDLRCPDGDREDAAARAAPEGGASAPVRLGGRCSATEPPTSTSHRS